MSLHVYTPVEGGRMIKIAFVFFFLDTVVFFFLERSGSSRGIRKTFEIIVTLKKKINLIKLIVYFLIYELEKDELFKFSRDTLRKNCLLYYYI